MQNPRKWVLRTQKERRIPMAKREKLTEKGVPYGARQRMPIRYGAV